MKTILLLTGAAALAFAGPAFAKPGHGQRQGHANPYAHGVQGPVGYGIGGCPPGLNKKNNGCMPPGQAKKLFNVGQRFRPDYGDRWRYNQLPYDLRQQYGLRPNDRYYYRDGYLYRVDPRTMVVEQVISALLGG